MNNKDISNLSNIYQNILKEAQMGSGLSQPIQLGSGINKGGPNSDVVVKVKKYKKKTKNKRIFEGFIGGFLKGIEMAKKGELPTFSKNKDKKKSNYQKTPKKKNNYKKTPKKKGSYNNPKPSVNPNIGGNSNITP
jgi:hypothetical protein